MGHLEQGRSALRGPGAQPENSRTPNGKTPPNILGDANDLSREAIEALPAAVYMTDAEGRITFYNEAAAALWGCHPEVGETSKSKFCGSWKLYWPDGTPLPHDKCPMAMALRQKRPIRGTEAIAERPDGTRVPFIPYPTPLFDASGRLTGAINMLVDISDHKRAETHLAERNAQLDLAGKIARIGSFTYDDATQILQLSPGCAAIYGLPEGRLEISREDWRTLVDPDDLRRLDVVTRRALANRQTELVLEFRILRHGEVRWIESRVLILFNEVGRTFQRIGSQVDVTERKRAELALVERNTQLELAGQTARVGSLAIDLSTTFVNLSPGSAMILGLPESRLEMSRNNARKLVHPHDLAQLDAARDHAFLKKQREFVAQFRILRANDGEIRWIEARSLIFYDQSDQPLRLVAVIIDFTERKCAEQALVERNILLALAGRAARVGTFAYDTDKEILQISEDYAAIHGLPEGTAKIARSEWLAGVHPQDVERVELPRNEAFRAQRNEYSAEFRIIRPGGEVRWVEIRCFITYDANGHPKRVVGVSTDVTDRKQAELALGERNTQLTLAGKVALVGSYAYDVDADEMQVSEGYAAIHGLPDGTVETTRSAWRTRVHPEDVGRVHRLRNRALRDRRSEHNFEYRIVCPDRGLRWIESRSFISYNGDGSAQRVIGINIDVTDRKQTEARLSDALEAGQVVAFEWDAVTGQSQRSENADRVIGFVGDGRFLKQVHPDNRDYFKTLLRSISPDNPSYSSTFRFVRSDGRLVCLEETGKGEFDRTGRLLHIKGLTRDITERKQAELALAERNTQLALAGKAGLVATFAYDVKTNRVQISEGYAAIYGFPEGTTEIERGQWRALVLPDDLERLDSLRSQAFADRLREYGLEYRIMLPDRGVRWIETRSFALYDGEGRPQRVVGVNIDITERKRAEESRKILNAELDHRVKNALATVTAVISHTRQETRSVADFAAALEGRIRSMAATHELLSSRHWQELSLIELIRRELAPYAARNNTEINGPTVLLKPEAGQAMAMVLHELATNAAKYGAFSTKEGRVSVRWYRRLNGDPLSNLVLEWREVDGPRVNTHGKSSYGTSTIRDLIPYEFGGMVDLVFTPEGVRCRLELPANWLTRSNEGSASNVSHPSPTAGNANP